MKKAFRLLSICLCLIISQITMSQINQGMAIQGIARDGNNTAITNTSITLKFTIHYLNPTTNQDVALSPMQATIATDNFGVFSYILDVSNIEAALFFNYQLKLKIELTAPSIAQLSDENLNSVPYAVSAQNGVPTGTIMPFVGTVAPAGWALCNGASLPVTATTLIAMLGSNNAPDLRGMFLRGAGAYNNGTDFVGPSVKNYQDGSVGQHLHGLTGTILSSIIADHSHLYNDAYYAEAKSVTFPWNNSNGSLVGSGYPVDRDNNFIWRNKNKSSGEQSDSGDASGDPVGISTSGNGSHNHSVNLTGSSTLNNIGIVETRPKNYGINYIIKL